MKKLGFLAVSLVLLATQGMPPLANAATPATAPAPARSALTLEADEQAMFEQFKGLVTVLSPSGKVSFDAVSGEKQTEFRVMYPASEEKEILGLGGTTRTALMTLFNELSIAHGHAAAKAAGVDYKIADRKLLLLRFIAVAD